METSGPTTLKTTTSTLTTLAQPQACSRLRLRRLRAMTRPVLTAAGASLLWLLTGAARVEGCQAPGQPPTPQPAPHACRALDEEACLNAQGCAWLVPGAGLQTSYSAACYGLTEQCPAEGSCADGLVCVSPFYDPRLDCCLSEDCDCSFQLCLPAASTTCEGLDEQTCLLTVGCLAHYDQYCTRTCSSDPDACCFSTFADCVAAPGSCGAPLAVVEPQLGAAFALALAQAATFAGQPPPLYSTPPLERLTFSAVLEDSRCPANALCVWEGQVSIELTLVFANDDGQTITLTGLPTPESPVVVFVGEYLIQLEALDPYPISATPPDPCQYEATLRVDLIGCG